MRRLASAVVVASVIALVIAACGGSTPVTPTPGTGGGGGGSGSTPNTPPTIKSIVVSDTRIEVGIPITVSATVEDAATAQAKAMTATRANNDRNDMVSLGK